MRLALPAAALALLAPAPASAAPFGELASRAVRGDVSCLRATGEPGGLSLGDGSFPGRARLLRADATGLQPGAAVPVTTTGSCPELDLRASGAGVAAYFFAGEPEDSGVRVLLRTGATWGAPAEVLGDTGRVALDGLAAGSSDAGAAVVASTADSDRGLEVTATRRAPGGGFGPTETLMVAPDFSGRTMVRAGVTAAGETIVAWSFRPGARAPRELWATYAAPGAAFAAPVRVGAPSGPFALAVGDGGHAVLAFTADKRMSVAERGPGAGFGPARVVGVADDPLTVFPAAAVRADGAAVVGWADYFDGAVRAVARPGPGPFGAQVQLARRVPLGFDRALLDAVLNTDFSDGDASLEGELQPIAVAFAGDRALLAWTAVARRDDVYSLAPSVAELPLTGAPAEVEAVGNGLRETRAVAPLVLADATPAIAWSEEDSDRVHLSVEGAAAAADPPAPDVRIGRPKQRVIAADASIALPVTCSAACDVRASAGRGAWSSSATVSLRRAGSGRLVLSPDLAPLARLDGRPIAVHVRSGAPGTRHPHSATVMVGVRREPGPPLPRVRGVRARHDGDDVVVTWRTDRDADEDSFYVYATAESRGDALGASQATGAKRRFRARIRNVPAARSVTLLTGGESAGIIRRTTVEIR